MMTSDNIAEKNHYALFGNWNARSFQWRLWRLRTFSCLVAFLLMRAAYVPLGQALGILASVSLLWIERALWSLDTLGSCERSFSIDLFRGAVLQHIIIFHMSWDFQYAGVSSMCSRYTSLIFPVAVVGGHAVIIAVATRYPKFGELLLCLLSWVLTTAMRSSASKMGMCLMMFTSGYTSFMMFKKARSMRVFVVRALRHICLLALCAATITFVTLFVNRRRAIFFGAVHLLTLGGIVALPFHWAPNVAVCVGGALLILRVSDSIGEFMFYGGMDIQPTYLGLGAQLLGVGASRFQVLEVLHTLLGQHKGTLVLEWLGRRSLLAFLGHQVVLYPAALGLAALLSAIGIRVQPMCLADWFENPFMPQKYVEPPIEEEVLRLLMHNFSAANSTANLTSWQRAFLHI